MCIFELWSELFFSFGLQTKGDVHGGGEGVQHWAGHCYAADQAEGNGAEHPQEARLLLRRVREYCAVPPQQGTSVPPRGQNLNGSAPTQMFSARLPGYTFVVAGIVSIAGCVHHLPRHNFQQQRMAWCVLHATVLHRDYRCGVGTFLTLHQIFLWQSA